MIGQQKLLEKLNSYQLTTLPHSILLLGEEGCGRHTIVKDLANRFSLDIVEIDSKVNYDDIIEYRQDVNNKIYLIDLATFTEVNQNKLLKFIEEPAQTNYIILIAESEIGILSTIINRCQVYRFEEYTEAELRQIKDTKNDLSYKICKTPGKLLNADIKSLETIKKTCENIVVNIKAIPYLDLLKMKSKLNYKEEYDKFDFSTFINMLSYISFNHFMQTNSKDSYTIYNVMNNAKQKLINNKSINKEYFMLHLLDELWSEVRIHA